MSDRLYIKDIIKVLPYRDLRSIHRWCRNNGVRLLRDIGSKSLFAFKDEFEKAMDRMKDFSTSNNSKPGIRSTGKEDNYKPQGTIESSFLSILQNLTATL